LFYFVFVLCFLFFASCFFIRFFRLFSLVAHFCFFTFYVLVFCSLYFSAHMYISSTVQRGWWDLNIQPHSP
jgi:hypothetical protein